MPVILVDANAKLGIVQRLLGCWAGWSVGFHSRAEMDYNGYHLRELLRYQHMCTVNSFYVAGSTYYHCGGQCYIFVPCSRLGKVSCCQAWTSSGARLQLINGRGRRDHMPLSIWIDLRLAFEAPGTDNIVWDHDWISLNACKRIGREVFVAELEDKLSSAIDAKAAALQGPDSICVALHDAILPVPVGHSRKRIGVHRRKSEAVRQAGFDLREKREQLRNLEVGPINPWLHLISRFAPVGIARFAHCDTSMFLSLCNCVIVLRAGDACKRRDRVLQKLYCGHKSFVGSQWKQELERAKHIYDFVGCWRCPGFLLGPLAPRSAGSAHHVLTVTLKLGALCCLCPVLKEVARPLNSSLRLALLAIRLCLMLTSKLLRMIRIGLGKALEGKAQDHTAEMDISITNFAYSFVGVSSIHAVRKGVGSEQK